MRNNAHQEATVRINVTILSYLDGDSTLMNRKRQTAASDYITEGERLFKLGFDSRCETGKSRATLPGVKRIKGTPLGRVSLL